MGMGLTGEGDAEACGFGGRMNDGFLEVLVAWCIIIPLPHVQGTWRWLTMLIS